MLWSEDRREAEAGTVASLWLGPLNYQDTRILQSQIAGLLKQQQEDERDLQNINSAINLHAQSIIALTSGKADKGSYVTLHENALNRKIAEAIDKGIKMGREGKTTTE